MSTIPLKHMLVRDLINSSWCVWSYSVISSQSTLKIKRLIKIRKFGKLNLFILMLDSPIRTIFVIYSKNGYVLYLNLCKCNSKRWNKIPWRKLNDFYHWHHCCLRCVAEFLQPKLLTVLNSQNVCLLQWPVLCNTLGFEAFIVPWMFLAILRR